MHRQPHRTPLTVCPIAQDCLAEAYLAQLLQRERAIRVFSLKTYNQLSPAQQRHIIFVIDQYGLELPLSEYVRHLRGKCPDAKFIVLNNAKSQDEVTRLLIMGVHGYVPHEEAQNTLVRAVLSVAANQLWVRPEVFQEFLAEVGSLLGRNGHVRNSTTSREHEILELVRRRLSNKEIAELLHIRVSTVKFHLSNILAKLHVTSRHELTETPSEKLRRLFL